MEILNRLNRSYPIAENDVERGVHELLGPINKRIVGEAADALREGDARRLGALMTEAQALFDQYGIPACPEELTAPVLHKVLSYAPLAPHIWGGKGVGSQGDGTAQFMARSAEDQRAVIEILENDLHLSTLALTMRPSQRIRRAVIPAAGFGTRLFPASKATKKELFPVVDRGRDRQTRHPLHRRGGAWTPGSKRSSSSSNRTIWKSSAPSSTIRCRWRTSTNCRGTFRISPATSWISASG